VIDAAIAELAPLIGKRAACRATGRAQANHYRRHRQSAPALKPQVSQAYSSYQAVTSSSEPGYRSTWTRRPVQDPMPSSPLLHRWPCWQGPEQRQGRSAVTGRQTASAGARWAGVASGGNTRQPSSSTLTPSSSGYGTSSCGPIVNVAGADGSC
jgi:hypothetical protein